MLRPPWLRSLGPLVRADLRRKYAGSALGGVWALLAPVLEIAIYAVVFGWMLGASAASQPMPYAILIASGLLPWAAFREAIEGCSAVLADNRWIRRSRVPMDLLVARLVATASLRAVVALVVVIGFALVSGRGVGLLGLVFPLIALLVQVILTYGIGRLLAPLGALVPDSRPTLVSVLTLLTFAGPILYPESLARGWWAPALSCNPFTHLLRLYRFPIQGLPWQSALASLAFAAGAALAALGLGEWVRWRLWWRARDLL